jgi:hypothetical protein
VAGFEGCSFFIDMEAGFGGSHHTNLQKPKNSSLSSVLTFNKKEVVPRVITTSVSDNLEVENDVLSRSEENIERSRYA